MTVNTGIFQNLTELMVVCLAWYYIQVARPSKSNLALALINIILAIDKLVVLAIQTIIMLIPQLFEQVQSTKAAQSNRTRFPDPTFSNSHYWYRQRRLHQKTQKRLKYKCMKLLRAAYRIKSLLTYFCSEKSYNSGQKRSCCTHHLCCIEFMKQLWQNKPDTYYDTSQ